jgi:membrane protein YqaA with SNARE-associated domain
VGTVTEKFEASPERKRGFLRGIYGWVMRWSAHEHARTALFVLAFAEASICPIPADVLLIAMALADSRKARGHALVCSVGSVTGGVAGFYIGYGLWQSLQGFFFKYLAPIGFTHENFEIVQKAYQENAFLAVFTAGFTPIPYKVFTIAAGVFEVALPVFLIASLLGRSARFFLVAELVKRIGPPVLPFIEKHLGWLTFLLAFLIILGFVAIKLLA